MENNEVMFDGIDISSVVDMKVSQSDLVELVIEKKKVLLRNKRVALVPVYEELKKREENIQKKWEIEVATFFASVELKKITELKKIFPDIKSSKNIEPVGRTWDKGYENRLTYITTQWNEYRSIFATSINGTHNIMGGWGDITWAKLYHKASFILIQRENKQRKNAQNFRYEFTAKRKTDSPKLRKYHAEWQEVQLEKGDYYGKISLLDSKLTEIEKNTTKYKAHVTQQILSSTGIGQQLLGRMDASSNLLKSGE